MRKGIMSLEEHDLAVREGELDLDNADSETEASEIANDSDRIAETESIADAVDSYTEQVASKVEDGEGISEETAQALEVAVEHFKHRLGYSKTVMPAFEGFKDRGSRLAKSRVTLENLKTLQTCLKANLVVAQEGFFSRIKNAIVRAFTSDKKIVSQLEKIMHLPAVETKEIKDPAWGRVFARSGKYNLTGAMIIAYFTELSSSSDKEKLKNIMVRSNKILNDAHSQSRNAWRSETTSLFKEFTKLNAESSEMLSEFKELLEKDRGDENDVNVTTATTEEVKKLSKLVIDVVTDRVFEKLLNDYEAAWTLIFSHDVDYGDDDNKLIIADDKEEFAVTAERLIQTNLDTVGECIYTYVSIEHKAAYSAYKYLEASTM